MGMNITQGIGINYKFHHINYHLLRKKPTITGIKPYNHLPQDMKNGANFKESKSELKQYYN